MDILAIIKKEHDEALAMIEALEERSAGKVNAKTETMVKELVLAVRLHLKSEEAALYIALEEDEEEFRNFCLEGYNEHDLLDVMLEKLLRLPPGGDGELRAALKVCKDLIKHHGKEEEEKTLFPKLKKRFSKEELMDMGGVMEEEKERLRPALEDQLADPDLEPAMRDTKPLTAKAKKTLKAAMTAAHGSSRAH